MGQILPVRDNTLMIASEANDYLKYGLPVR